MQLIGIDGKFQQPTLEFRTPAKEKIEFSFQDLGVEMMNHFGKQNRGRIWPLFVNKKYPEGKIRDAWIAYQKGNVKNINYFMGILNKL